MLQLASHLDKPEVARALYLLTRVRVGSRAVGARAAARAARSRAGRAAQHATHRARARNVVGRRRPRRRASSVAYPVSSSASTKHRGRTCCGKGPRRSHDTRSCSNHCPRARTQRVRVVDDWVDVAARDRPGLLASVTGVLVEFGFDVREAIVATWPDGAALESFCVAAEEPIDADAVARGRRASFTAPLASAPLPEATVDVRRRRVALAHRVRGRRAGQAWAAPRVRERVRGRRRGGALRSRLERQRHGPRPFRCERSRRPQTRRGTKADVRKFVAGGVTTKRRRFRRPVFSPAAL